MLGDCRNTWNQVFQRLSRMSKKQPPWTVRQPSLTLALEAEVAQFYFHTGEASNGQAKRLVQREAIFRVTFCMFRNTVQQW